MSTVDRIRAWAERLISPDIGTCYRCRRPWRFGRSRRSSIVGVIEHATSYGDGNRGCFPLCETCWAGLAPSERVPYYDQLVDTWIRVSPERRGFYERERSLIRDACLSESVA